jgi:hypothetical protein
VYAIEAELVDSTVKTLFEDGARNVVALGPQGTAQDGGGNWVAVVFRDKCLQRHLF